MSLGNYSRGPLLQTRCIGVCVTRCWWARHVWPALWCVCRITAVGGTWARWQQQRTTLSSAGRLGEQLLRAICLTSQIVGASEKGIGTALPAMTHWGFSGVGGLRPRLESKDGQAWWGAGSWGCGRSSILSVGLFAFHLEMLPFAANGSGSRVGAHASINTELDLNAQREELCVLPWRIFLQTESVIV